MALDKVQPCRADRRRVPSRGPALPRKIVARAAATAAPGAAKPPRQRLDRRHANRRDRSATARPAATSARRRRLRNTQQPSQSAIADQTSARAGSNSARSRCWRSPVPHTARGSAETAKAAVHMRRPETLHLEPQAPANKRHEVRSDRTCVRPTAMPERKPMTPASRSK